MPEESVKSTSPDTFLRRNSMKGADASTRPIGGVPILGGDNIDTLYQTKESTTYTPNPDDPREPKD